MPIRTRRCQGCRRRYDVVELGARTFRLADGHEPPECPHCGVVEWVHVPNLRVHAIGLGGEAGVGKHYPYFDRGLGTHVRDAAHRRHLLEYTPQGQRRPERLIPLDTATDSGLRGTWEDIADADAAEAAEDARVYEEFMREQREGPNRAAYHKVVEHLEDQGVTVAD